MTAILSEQTERLNKAMTGAMHAMFAANVSGDEYLFILQTLAATALSENAKSVENKWVASLKTDVLNRRLAKVRANGQA